MEKECKIIVTADIHFERLDLSAYENYVKLFKDAIRTHSPNYLIFAGDTADSRNLKAESIEYEMLTSFILTVSKLCDTYGVIFNILKGTPSHDGDILKNIINVHSLNISYFDELKVVDLNGYSTLFMHELYCRDLNHFDEMICDVVGGKDSKVDLCVFHGMFDFAIPQLKQIDSSFNQTRSVVINAESFEKDYINILAIGGHVHKFINEGNVYYTGRFINEVLQNHKTDVYGLKLVELRNDDYNITNIDHEYLVKHDFVTLIFNSKSILDDIVTDLHVNNVINENTVFMALVDNDRESREIFTMWKNVYRPHNIRRKLISVKVAEIGDSINRIGATKLDTSDIDLLMKAMYEDETGDILSEQAIRKIKKGVD